MKISLCEILQRDEQTGEKIDRKKEESSKMKYLNLNVSFHFVFYLIHV